MTYGNEGLGEQAKAFDVTIVDCGIGNIRSVQRMFEASGASTQIADDPSTIAECRRLVLPGVGAFDAGMAALEEGRWIDPLNHVALVMRRPILGICLGMQLLCDRSEEGRRSGLGWINADVVRVDTGGDPSLKIPHMGWTLTEPVRPSPLFPEIANELRFYYVHKYRVRCRNREQVIATARYGATFDCAINRDNIYGVQFHPEKSHRFGMDLMRRFVALPC
jgi:glutamine amidotransferase